jgi:hypothetical protein
MSCIILVRNPHTRKLLVITEDDGETPVEFDTSGEAYKAAKHIPICQAWDFDTVDVPS